jgi:hypothetical protein
MPCSRRRPVDEYTRCRNRPGPSGVDETGSARVVRSATRHRPTWLTSASDWGTESIDQRALPKGNAQRRRRRAGKVSREVIRRDVLKSQGSKGLLMLLVKFRKAQPLEMPGPLDAQRLYSAKSCCHALVCGADLMAYMAQAGGSRNINFQNARYSFIASTRFRP